MRRSAVLGFALAATLIGSSAPVGLSLVRAQEGTPDAACAATTPEENKDLVRQFLEAHHGGDEADAAALATDGITYHSHQRGEREGDAEGFLRGQRMSIPDATMTIDLLIADGDTVAAYVTWSGMLEGETHVVAGQDVSIPEDQRDAEWVGAVFFHMECGKIAEVRPVIDRLGHLMDLGVITQDDLQGADAAATPAP